MKFKISGETAMALAAMITAVAAVVVAVIQTDIMRREAENEREHARISVMPSIMLFYSNGNIEDGRRFFELNVQNMGLGPVIIEDFSLSYRGKKLVDQREWVATIEGELEENGTNLKDLLVSNSFVGPGRIIPAEQSATPIVVTHNILAPALQKALHETEFRVCGCSVYGDCQQVSGLAQRPVKVASCRVEDISD